MLEPDASARITMEQLLEDPWFLEGLPPDALTMNERYLRAGRSPTVQTEDEITSIMRTA